MRSIPTNAALTLGLLLAAGAAGPAAAQDGEALFRAQCATCHSVPAAGIEAKVKSGRMAGPELPGSVAELDPVQLRDFLRKETEMEEEHPKAFKGSDEELSALIAWLTSLSGGS